jgi:carboxyl-terminal processing protease
MTEFDVRIINGEVYVTTVKDSHQDDAQIKIGDRITKINSKPINEILSKFSLRPPNNQRNYNFLMTEELLRHIYGTDDSEVYLTTHNSSNFINNITVKRKERKNGTILFEGLPKVFLEISSQVYFDSIGYIKFNSFQPSRPTAIINKINEFKVLPSVIIDLRGNNGGSVEATRMIAAELLNNNEIYYNLVSSNETSRINYFSSNNPYKGKLVVLVDELSISAAEIVSDILQFTKSAKIVGQQTPGNVLSGELFPLSNNYNLLLPIQDWIRDDGFRLEGNGVKPDYTIELREIDLQKSIDTQLEFAINLLK